MARTPGMSGAEVTVFVAPDGNGFMRDIATWIVDAAASCGRRALLVDDRLPRPDGTINLVVAPHEFYVLRDDSDAEIRAAARCSVPICTEQPGTPWFNLAIGLCVGSPLVGDINATGASAIAREGFEARRLALGGVRSMDRIRDRVGERDIDVLFLGGHTDRRARVLAGLAPVLWDRRAEIRLFQFSRPIEGGEPGVVFGDDKYDLLARSKVLVNLHRSDDSDGYFEWARMVETMANRCAVVTEPSRGFEPLVPGVHFLEAPLDRLGATVIDVLDSEQRDDVTDAAYRAVMDEYPLANSLEPFLDDAAAALEGPDRRPPRWSMRLAARRRIVRAHRPPLLPEFRPHADLRNELYRQMIAERDHRRALGRVRALAEFGAEDHVERDATPAYATARPEVSVIVTLFDYADVVTETLASICASTDIDVEVIVVDDKSTDAGRSVVRSFMDDHADVPMVLLGSNVNRGLARARNLAVSASRADRVMVMDADNLVYPTCLRRLSDALDAHPDAAFAYATLEAFGAEPGLRSGMGWHVPWLCDANYIDAQAMIRRDALDRHGGYRPDGGVAFGWEDWDLWLRFAAAGEFGVHVAQLLGRYRTRAGSMIATANLVASEMRAELVERYPSLPWPETTSS
ncbi:MAG: glycosyltransferase family 2 protein [Ilumatobacter sp.]|nr:glycosyltransferase family 2 protein [Ilumatobacter sp.]